MMDREQALGFIEALTGETALGVADGEAYTSPNAPQAMAALQTALGWGKVATVSQIRRSYNGAGWKNETANRKALCNFLHDVADAIDDQPAQRMTEIVEVSETLREAIFACHSMAVKIQQQQRYGSPELAGTISTLVSSLSPFVKQEEVKAK